MPQQEMSLAASVTETCRVWRPSGLGTVTVIASGLYIW